MLYNIAYNYDYIDYQGFCFANCLIYFFRSSSFDSSFLRWSTLYASY